MKVGDNEKYGYRKCSSIHLVGNVTVTGEVGVLLVVVEPCLDHPLVA